MTSQFPLAFPPNQPRTPAHYRESSAFKVGFAQARSELIEELNRIGAVDVIISTNVLDYTRDNGLPFPQFSEPPDPGVAVWFVWSEKQYCFACDAWVTARENMRAVGLQLQALRPIWQKTLEGWQHRAISQRV